MLKAFSKNTRIIKHSLHKSIQLQPCLSISCFSSIIKGNFVFSNNYEKQYIESIDPTTRNAFWTKQANSISWTKPFKEVFAPAQPGSHNQKWFLGGETNMCFNCVDRHLKTSSKMPALIYESPMINKSEIIEYGELHKRVTIVAGMLHNLGIKKGDNVMIVMPNIPEAAYCMLACARLGAVHSVVFCGYNTYEIARRIKDINPTIIISASSGLGVSKSILLKEKIDYAISLAQASGLKNIVYQRDFKQENYNMKKGLDFDFYELYNLAKPMEKCEPMESNDPLYILYTSGQTRSTFPLSRDVGGTSVALHYATSNIFDIHQNNVFFSTFDLGWIVGHSFGLYGPLLVGAATVLYEGKPVNTPDAGAYWRIVQQHKVKGMFSFPSALKAVMLSDPDGQFVKKCDVSSLRSLSVAGERCDPQIFHWTQSYFKNMLFNDNYWQTESGWPMISNFANNATMTTFHSKAGSCGKPVPGFDVRLLDENKDEVGDNVLGNIAIKFPLPPSFCSVFGKQHHIIDSSLYNLEGYYFTGDAGYRDTDGSLHILTRSNDVLDIFGFKLSMGSIEEALTSHKDVLECACIAIEMPDENVTLNVHDQSSTQKVVKLTKQPLAFIVLKPDVKIANLKMFKQELIHIMRHEIGPIAYLKHCFVVPALPKSHAGHVSKKLLRDLVERNQEATKEYIEKIKNKNQIQQIQDSIDAVLLNKKVN